MKNLGVFLAMGDSFKNMSKTGQDMRFIKNYLNQYSKNFNKVFIFSYEKKEEINLPKNVIIVENNFGLHRYIYACILPLLHFKYFIKIDVIRAFHVSGAIPAIIVKVIYHKPYIFNYAYDYYHFSKIEGKFFQSIIIKSLDKVLILFSSKVIAANKRIQKFIGSSVKILAGVRIGRGSVIGAGSVVNKNIPNYCLAVGVPAIIKKKRVKNH